MSMLWLGQNKFIELKYSNASLHTTRKLTETNKPISSELLQSCTSIYVVCKIILTVEQCLQFHHIHLSLGQAAIL